MLANAVVQLKMLKLTHRIREQARSHIRSLLCSSPRLRGRNRLHRQLHTQRQHELLDRLITGFRTAFELRV